MRKKAPILTSLQFFAKLKWLDGRPLLNTMQHYRREIFRKAFDTFRPDGSPQYNMVVTGRAKKNDKTSDLCCGALYSTVIRRSLQGNVAFILAADEDQAADDLDLVRKLVEVNPELRAEFDPPLAKELRLRDGSGSIKILPAKDVAGMHGKTFSFAGYDEVHNQKSWDVFEALSPDPTRADCLQWITSYDTIYNVPGVPLYDLKQIGFAGSDPRMLFSWYSADRCTDPASAGLPPEERANPSMASWSDGADYLAQQRRRLPTHKFRRLHLNLPGAPEGAFLDQGKVLAAIVSGRRSLPPQPGVQYHSFCDLSGGSSDDAVLAIGHAEDRTFVLDLVDAQAGRPPFDPRQAVVKFVTLLRLYGCNAVWGDDYAGQTFKGDFAVGRITYRSPVPSKSELYEKFEPQLNAGEVELLDQATAQEQFCTLVMRGAKIDHPSGEHDDYANAIAGCAWVVREASAGEWIRNIASSGLLGRTMAMPARRAFGSMRTRTPLMFSISEDRQCMPLSSLPPSKQGN